MKHIQSPLVLLFCHEDLMSSCDWFFKFITLKVILYISQMRRRKRKGDRGWDGWMTSLTQWTWVWVNARSWWWTGRIGVLQSMESQSRKDWATELNWTELMSIETRGYFFKEAVILLSWMASFLFWTIFYFLLVYKKIIYSLDFRLYKRLANLSLYWRADILNLLTMMIVSKYCNEL